MARKPKRNRKPAVTIIIDVGLDVPLDPLEIHFAEPPALTTREQHARKPWWGKDDGRYITWGESRRG